MRHQLKQLLLDLSYEEKEVVLASGKKSNFYINVKQTALHPQGSYLLGHLLFEAIQKKFPQAKAVGGPTLGADPLITAVSLISFEKQKPIAAFIIRKEPKKHGTQAWIEGDKNLSPKMPVVILEDVITSGGSALSACDKAKESNLEILGILSVVDRQEGGRETIEKNGYSVEALFTKSDLLEGL